MLLGQAVSTSQIRGVIQDPTGAVIAGAEVKVRQTDTGAVRAATSEVDGSYALPGLPVGPYQLEVTKQGFSKYLQSGIVLQVNVNPTIDVTLKVGALTEEISVQANAAMVETQNTSVGQVVDEKRVVELPLNGRQPTDLIFLTPSVTTGRTFRASYPSSVSVSISGGTVGSVAFALDGGTNNDGLSNQNLPLPFPDALQEFKVETSSLPAQYGYYSSGSVNAVTKSGTNGFHGDLFEFVRNYDFNARNTFDAKRDNLKRNQFGGTLGGPIKKDKLFFFLGYQDSLIRSAPDAPPAFVPTTAMLSGDFSACPTFAPRAVPSGFTISPIARAVSSLLPATSDPCGRVTYPQIASYTENQGIARMDYQVSPRHSLFARYFITRLEQPPGDPKANLLVAAQLGFSDQVQNLTVGDTYLLNARTVNSFRLTGTRSYNTTVVGDYANLSQLGVQGLFQMPSIKGLSSRYVSNLVVNGAFSVTTTPAVQPYDTLAFNDDVNIQRGPHQISFGGNFTDVRAFAVNYLNTNGNATFTGQPGSPLSTGSGMADFIYGRPVTFSQLAPIYSDQRQIVFGFYGQDSWKLSRRLTVNAGLRWDPFLAHVDPYQHAYRFDLSAFRSGFQSRVYPNSAIGILYPGDPGGPVGGRFADNKMKQFSPRVGIAFDPLGNGKTSIRAGWGLFYNFPAMSFDQFGVTTPFGGSVTVNNPLLGSPWSSLPGGTSPFPGLFGTKGSLFPTNGNNYSYPADTPPPSVQQFNFSFQQQLGSDWLVSATYLGNVSRHLWIDQQLNPAVYIPGNCAAGQYGLTAAGLCSTTGNTLFRRALSLINPNQTPASNAPFNTLPYFQNVNVIYPFGTGSYNGLVLTASHRLARNFSSTTNYTWAHCISDLYSPGLGFGPFMTANPNSPRGDRGNCPGADVRQAFNESLIVSSPKFGDRMVQMLAGDWRLGVAIKVDSGGFLVVNTVTDVALNGNGGVQRPNQVLPDVYLPNKDQSGWLNRAAFANAATGSYGNLGANNIQAPGAINVDVSLSRIFRVRERQQVEFRAEAFNLPNLVNLYNPVTTLTSANFGVPAPPAARTPRQDPRILQFALKYIF